MGPVSDYGYRLNRRRIQSYLRAAAFPGRRLSVSRADGSGRNLLFVANDGVGEKYFCKQYDEWPNNEDTYYRRYGSAHGALAPLYSSPALRLMVFPFLSGLSASDQLRNRPAEGIAAIRRLVLHLASHSVQDNSFGARPQLLDLLATTRLPRRIYELLSAFAPTLEYYRDAMVGWPSGYVSHSDIKPDNVFVRDDRVVLIDWELVASDLLGRDLARGIALLFFVRFQAELSNAAERQETDYAQTVQFGLDVMRLWCSAMSDDKVRLEARTFFGLVMFEYASLVTHWCMYSTSTEIATALVTHGRLLSQMVLGREVVGSLA